MADTGGNFTAEATAEVRRRARKAALFLAGVNLLLLALALLPAPVGPTVLEGFVLFALLQFAFALLWFLPVLAYYVLFKRRSLSESAARALWSFVDVLANLFAHWHPS